MCKKDKTVYILTFHNTLNYGATMQCYALHKYLKLSGFNCFVVDYQSARFKREYSPFYVSSKSLKGIAYMLVALPMNIIKIIKKKNFDKKYMSLTDKLNRNALSTLDGKNNYFIVGSDQVWNYTLTDSDNTYLLGFVNEGQKISYAASLGLAYIAQKDIPEYKTYLNDFDFISVRENKGAEIIRSLIPDLKVDIVLDPVFLLSIDTWQSMIKKPNLNNYIVLYRFRSHKAIEYALNLANKTGKKLVYLGAPIKSFEKCKKVRNIGPDEWLSWLFYADYVISDSFHATAFAIIFHKEFITYRFEGKYSLDSRIETLLQDLNLINRLVPERDITEKFEKIDYSAVQDRLDKVIAHSKSFLADALNGADCES